MAFQQENFEYRCLFAESSLIADVVDHLAHSDHCSVIKEELSGFSKRTLSEALPLMWQAERNQPALVQYDHWGKRIDHIEVDPAWEALHVFSAKENLIRDGYERRFASDSRLLQFLKLMIFHPSSAFYTCPLAMTDGAARVLELENGPLKEKFFNSLTSNDPHEFCTAGQWMTEKAGGSDVSQSETRAEEKGGRYFLYGVKWFTSAITANIAMTLAQTEVNGKRRLSLFLVEIRDSQGQLNSIEVLRLKDKLGTKAMPTAELKLNGVEGQLIGHIGDGIKNISTVLNISRLYNAVCATGTLLRLQSLICDYSQKRLAFGKKLIDHPLHQKTLLATQADVQGCVLFVSQLAKLLGLSETGEASSQQQALLRLMTPVVKLWTAKKALWGVSELLEAFGGAGYIEDTQLPRFLRDVQVFPIWEGTTNIMSLDTLRALSKDDVARDSALQLKKMFSTLQDSSEKAKLVALMEQCMSFIQAHQSNPEALQLGARHLAYSLGDLMAGISLLQFAQATNKRRDRIIAEHFISSLQSPDFNEPFSAEDRRETLLS